MIKITNKSTRLHTIHQRKIIPGKTETFDSLTPSEYAIVLVFVKKGELELIQDKSPVLMKTSKEKAKESIDAAIGKADLEDQEELKYSEKGPESLVTKKKPGRPNKKSKE